MRFHAGWQIYNQGRISEVHETDIENERDLRQLLETVKKTRAEEVVLYPVNGTGNQIGQRMEFQLNEDKTLAYVVCALQESIGRPESPEIFTTSGGSFSAGTGIPIATFEDAITEFVRTGEQPTNIQWRNENDDLDAPLNKDDDIPF